jgi:hypothetical protein
MTEILAVSAFHDHQYLKELFRVFENFIETYMCKV